MLNPWGGNGLAIFEACNVVSADNYIPWDVGCFSETL